MPTWGELLKELGRTNKNVFHGESEYDVVRRKYLKLLADYTKRNVISYTSCWTTSTESSSPTVGIVAEDIQGFMEVVHGLVGDDLDLIIHSPGGSPEATEAVVKYLRKRFKSIRVFIPQAAMSAATMLACAADEIVLGKHSAIGPIDPQMLVRVDGQLVIAPAAAIKRQFEQAKEEIALNPASMPAWIPILRQYGPALLAQCRYAEDLSKELVEKWLTEWMFHAEADGPARAKAIASRLATHANFNSHGRFISRDDARSFGLKIADLENDQKLQDLVLSVFHSATITYSATPTLKIIENHQKRAFIKQERRMVINLEAPPGTPPAPPATPPGIPSGPTGSPFKTPKP